VAAANPLFPRAAAQVVGLARKLGVAQRRKRIGGERLAIAVAAVGDVNGVGLGDESDALRFAETFNRMNHLARFEVNHLKRVITERRQKEPLALDVHGQMINTPFHGGQRDGLSQSQWLLLLRRRAQEGQKDKDDQTWNER